MHICVYVYFVDLFDYKNALQHKATYPHTPIAETHTHILIFTQRESLEN